jgi:hypothetical protein
MFLARASTSPHRPGRCRPHASRPTDRRSPQPHHVMTKIPAQAAAPKESDRSHREARDHGTSGRSWAPSGQAVGGRCGDKIGSHGLTSPSEDPGPQPLTTRPLQRDRTPSPRRHVVPVHGPGPGRSQPSTRPGAAGAGDIAVVGSESFANLHEQLLSWQGCQPLRAEYCAEVGLPPDAQRVPGPA